MEIDLGLFNDFLDGDALKKVSPDSKLFPRCYSCGKQHQRASTEARANKGV